MKYFFLAFFTTLVCLGAYLSFSDKPIAASVSFGMATVCAIFALLAKFKRFKGFGIEAEALVNRLSDLAVAVSKPIFMLLARVGGLSGGTTVQERYEMVQEIEGVLRSINVSAHAIESAKIELNTIDMHDLTEPLRDHITQLLRKKVEDRRLELDRNFPQPVTPTPEFETAHKSWVDLSQEAEAFRRIFHDLHERPGMFKEIPARIENFITSCSLLSDSEKNNLFQKFEGEIKNMKHYAEHLTIRKKDE